jgi:hypothetical protein
VRYESDESKPKFQSVSLEVKSKSPESKTEAQLLDRYLANEFLLRRKQLVTERADITVTATIEEFTGISQTARLWLGSLAGQGVVRVRVEVTGSGLSAPLVFVVDSRAAGASSTGDWWSGYGGSTEDLLERTAKEIINYIL